MGGTFWAIQRVVYITNSFNVHRMDSWIEA
jgi:hypothetical protein